MSGTEPRRAWILTKLLVGEVTVAEAEALLQLSQRQVWRLKIRFERDGPAGLVHANRGRASPRRLSEQLRTLAAARGDLGSRPPSAGYRPAANHPWRRGPITRRTAAMTESPNR